MARLKVRLRGKTVYDIPLAEDRQYVAGRKEDCDIALQPEKGISREHFKLVFNGSVWLVEVVSRYGEVIINGESSQNFSLEHGVQFSVPPYEFEFLGTSAEVPMEGTGPGVSEVGGILPVAAGTDTAGTEDKTVIGAAPMSAYIKIIDSRNETKELIKLEAGDSWIAGRDASCNIHIRDGRVSRRQFEIRKVGPNYVILDLGSVNGTLLNGAPISTSDPTVLRSGDSISVLDNYLYFELHDIHFKSRLDMVDLKPLTPLVSATEEPDVSYGVMPYDNTGAPAPMVYQPQPQQIYLPPTTEGAGKFDFQKHRPKVIAGAVVLLAIAYLFSEPEKPKNSNVIPGQGVVAPGSPQDIFNKLKPEEQALIRQRHKDAKNMYMQGKYELAKQEAIKILEMVPDYEDTKELHRLSEEALFIQEERRRQEKLEQDRAEIERKIQKQTSICQKKIHPAITMADLESCLSDVLQFNPDHPRIMDLKARVESLTLLRETKAAERAAYNDKVARLRALYERAGSVTKKAGPLEGIAAYEKVLESSLPDPRGYKVKARSKIKSLRHSMNAKTANFQAKADQLYQAQNLKGAILQLRKARQVDPENTLIQEKIQRYTGELRKQMMVYYQEGILEESFGNVEGGESRAGAKEKWRKILDLDIPDGEYYKKAYIKLKKYGAL